MYSFFCSKKPEFHFKLLFPFFFIFTFGTLILVLGNTFTVDFFELGSACFAAPQLLLKLIKPIANGLYSGSHIFVLFITPIKFSFVGFGSGLIPHGRVSLHQLVFLELENLNSRNQF